MRAAQRTATAALGHVGHHELRNTQHQEDRERQKERVEFERLMEKADDLCEQFRMTNCSPALSVAIAVNGTMVYKKAFGCLDVENQVPATADMKFRVASISKPFAAHAWMKIMQDNDDFASKVKDNFGYRIQELIHGLPEKLYKLNLPESFLMKRWRSTCKSDEVPVTALLSHTSGYANVMFLTERQTFTACNSETQAFMLSSGHYNFYNRVPNSPISSYSNFNTKLLAAIIERFIPGIYRNYTETLMQEMGMRDSYFLLQDEIHPDYMSGYRNGQVEGTDNWGGPAPSGLVNEYRVDMSSRLAAEGVVSTASELVRFGNIYARGYLENFKTQSPEAKAPLSSQRIKEMFNNYSQPIYDQFPSSFDSKTLGWFRRDTVERCEPDDDDELQPCLLRQTLWHGGLGYGSSGVLGCTFYNIESDAVGFGETSPHAYLTDDDEVAGEEVTMLALSLPTDEEVSEAGFVSPYHYLPEEDREQLDALHAAFRKWKRNYERFQEAKKRALEKTEEQIAKITTASQEQVDDIKERHLLERHRVVLRMAGLRSELLADEARLEQQQNGPDPFQVERLRRKWNLYRQKISRVRTELCIAQHRLLTSESERYLEKVKDAQKSLNSWILHMESELAGSIKEFVEAEVTMKELLESSERSRCDKDILEIFGAGTLPELNLPCNNETRKSEAEIKFKRNFAKLKSYLACAGGSRREETDRAAADELLRLLLRYRPLPKAPRDEQRMDGGEKKLKLRESALVRKCKDEQIEAEFGNEENGSVVVAVLANHVILVHQLLVEQLTNLFGEFYILNPRES